MKRRIATILCVIMLLGVIAPTAFAATSLGLWYEENTTNWTGVSNAVYNAPVTPEKNAALNVWLKNMLVSFYSYLHDHLILCKENRKKNKNSRSIYGI